jgi:UDP-glucose 4-epimerase
MILVTGGGGFFGLNAARGLVEKGQEVLLVQRRSVQPPSYLAPFWGTNVKEARGSVMSLPFLISVAREYPIDGIVHAAVDLTGMDSSGTVAASSGRTLNDVVQDAIQGASNILELARLFNVKRVSFMSSVDTYRGFPKDCAEWMEDAFLPPVSFNIIGNTKKAVEQLCFLYVKSYGLSIISLRMGRCYGPSASHAMEPILQMVEGAVARKPIDLSKVPINSTGHTIYVKDAAEATALLQVKEKLGHYVYNVTDGGDPTMGEAAGIVKELIPGAQITLGPAVEGKYMPTPASNARLIEETRFAPRNLREGLRAYIDFVRGGTY